MRDMPGPNGIYKNKANRRLFMGISRRSFFKRSMALGTSGFVAAAPSLAHAAADTAKKPYKLVSTQEFTNICCYCAGGCGVICSVRNGELVNLEGDPDHPVNKGGLCPKGATMFNLRNVPQGEA